MTKKAKVAKKTSKKEKADLHLEVVLLDDVCEVLMKNVFRAMDVLRDASFCAECSVEKNK
jgi:hypothetical protein